MVQRGGEGIERKGGRKEDAERMGEEKGVEWKQRKRQRGGKKGGGKREMERDGSERGVSRTLPPWLRPTARLFQHGASSWHNVNGVYMDREREGYKKKAMSFPIPFPS